MSKLLGTRPDFPLSFYAWSYCYIVDGKGKGKNFWVGEWFYKVTEMRKLQVVPAFNSGYYNFLSLESKEHWVDDRDALCKKANHTGGYLYRWKKKKNNWTLEPCHWMWHTKSRITSQGLIYCHNATKTLFYTLVLMENHSFLSPRSLPRVLNPFMAAPAQAHRRISRQPER